MRFNTHFDLKDKHAFLSPSKYHWVNYDEERLRETFTRAMAVQKGTVLHDFASFAINIRQKQPRIKSSLNMFINDAIGYRMKSEQPLYYSQHSFGTADAISFSDNLLRIHDLKTGETPASMNQLYVYSALFCLEYSVKPEDIHIELRIYQTGAILVEHPNAEVIRDIMNKIVVFDQKLNEIISDMED